MSSLIENDFELKHTPLPDVSKQLSIKDGIQVTQFSRRIGDHMILYEIIRYPDRCTFIWIGTTSCEMSNLAVTMPTNLSSTNEVLGTKLFGNDFYDHSLAISKKLVRRFGGKKQIFVSLNLPNDSDNDILLSEVERALFQHVRENEEAY